MDNKDISSTILPEECVIELDKSDNKVITFMLKVDDPDTKTFTVDSISIPSSKLYDIIRILFK